MAERPRRWPWWLPRPPYTTEEQIEELEMKLRTEGIGWPIKRLIGKPEYMKWEERPRGWTEKTRKIFETQMKTYESIKQSAKDARKPWWIPTRPYMTKEEREEWIKNLKIEFPKFQMPKFEFKFPEFKLFEWPKLKIPWLPIGIIMGLGLALVIALKVD